jgi:methylmalonyl-CoA/ethylmalonyl-CoA epimerase
MSDTPPLFQGLDHIAIAVPDTDAALAVWRDRLGFPLLYSEVVNDGAVRLTHLDLGNVHLQLVEPLTPGHPLHAWIAKHGPALHHICLKVDNVDNTRRDAPNRDIATAATPHQGTGGKRALFLAAASTQGVQLEVTGA